MCSEKENTASQLSRGVRVTVLGAITNIALAALKIAVGWIAHSWALVADGIHSLTDLATDILVAFALIAGNRPKDEGHPYGHKKIETLTEIIVGLCLAGGALVIALGSVKALYRGMPVEPLPAALVVAGVSVAVKEFLYRYTIAANTTGSDAMLANAWHHRSDALTSLGVLATLVIVKFFPRLWVLDPLACIAISVVVGKIGLGVAYRAAARIVDSAPAPEIVGRIEATVQSHPGVRGLHKLRTRYLGSQIIADLHILVDPELTVREGHAIATEVEKAIKSELENIYDVTVHVEPALPEKVRE
ncbi:MAG: cation diffusion facilitator family transporter [Gemmatimonadota bacterium]|nr:cation diffusion facilitator family transporter [Gemmatimonadota bacterium]